MPYHILIPDSVDPAALDVLREAGEISVTAPGKMPREAVLAAIGEADGLIVRSGITVDAEVLQAAPRLMVIVRAGVGVDNIDLDEATRCGVAVLNTPDGNTRSTAEHTLGLLLALARHIPAAHQSMLAGRWDRKSFMGHELGGKTLGLLGFGRVGQEVAHRALAFEMTVITTDPFLDERRRREVAAMGVDVLDLDELFARSDIISLHSALTDETRGLIDAQSLARMKPGVWIVNAARGALIVEADLAAAIRSGQVAGAALDVYAQEPPSPDNPLIGLPGVILTPHLAASTVEAQVAVAVEAAHLIVDALLKGEYRNLRNPEALGGGG